MCWRSLIFCISRPMPQLQQKKRMMTNLNPKRNLKKRRMVTTKRKAATPHQQTLMPVMLAVRPNPSRKRGRRGNSLKLVTTVDKVDKNSTMETTSILMKSPSLLMVMSSMDFPSPTITRPPRMVLVKMVPNHLNYVLMNTLHRSRWNWKGLVVRGM